MKNEFFLESKQPQKEMEQRAQGTIVALCITERGNFHFKGR